MDVVGVLTMARDELGWRGFEADDPVVEIVMSGPAEELDRGS